MFIFRCAVRPRAQAWRAAALVLALMTTLLLGVVTASRAEAGAGTARLYAGERLVAGESLVSPSGALRLTMQGDGNLVLYAPGNSVRWYSHTEGNPGAWAGMQGDGNFVVYSASNVPLWHTMTDGSGATFAQLQDDGNFVLYRPAGWVWQTGTKYFPSSLASPGVLPAGGTLQSPNGAYSLVMQGDGNLVLYGPSGVRWQSDTDGTGANRLQIQSDGNMVLYTPSNIPTWHTQTNGRGAVSLHVQDDGNVVLYAASGGWAWQTYTYPGAQPAGASSKAATAIAYAEQQLGKPYVWGATGPNSFDCSGLTMRAWQAAGVTIPRVSQDQYAALPRFPYSQRQPGDLVFYANSGGVYHVAIYIGNDRMIEAPQPGMVVTVANVRSADRVAYVGRPA